MEQPNYYAIIPAAVRYDENLPANAKLLYGEITALTNSKGYCWATNEYFARLYKVDKKTISKWIQLLVDAGYLKSKIHFKKGTKQIEKRQLKISTPIHQKVDTYPPKDGGPSPQKNGDPIHQKVEENNTSINNTSINKESASAFLGENDFFNQAKDVWFKHHESWQFQSKDGAGIKAIIKKLNKWQSDAGKDVTPETTAAAFNYILLHPAVKGNSFLSTADPSTLNSKLNSIYEQIKSNPNGKRLNNNRPSAYDPSKSVFAD
jgi:hypothetical protein